jgi:hypothetical protein
MGLNMFRAIEGRTQIKCAWEQGAEQYMPKEEWHKSTLEKIA